MIAIAVVAVLIAVLAGLHVWTRVLSAAAEAAHPALGEFVAVEGLRQHAIAAGEGVPVVLIHGINGSLHDFTATVFTPLSREFRAIAVDRPGHGYSERPHGVYASPAVQARLLKGVLERFEVERPVLVGFSWAGSLVLSYALQFPDDVGALVLLNGAAYEWPGPIDLKYRMPAWPGIGPLLSETIALPLAGLVAEQGIAVAFAPEPVPASFANSPWRLAMRPASYRANAEDVRRLKPFLRSQSERYASIDTPTIIVTSDADRVVGPKIHSARLLQAVPNGEQIIVPGAGHPLPYSHPEVVIEAIRRAAARRGEGGRG